MNDKFKKALKETVKELQIIIRLYDTSPIIRHAIKFTVAHDPTFAKHWEQAKKIARGELHAEM